MMRILMIIAVSVVMIAFQSSYTTSVAYHAGATMAWHADGADPLDIRYPSGLTAAEIDSILASYRSPATGSGQWFVDYGARYGIDPSYALAVFIHESSAGTNPAWAGWITATQTTHNIGNIVCAGYPTCHGRFRSYRSWEEGIADWYRLIAVEYRDGRGLTSMRDIIPIYAPAADGNDVASYLNHITTLITEWRQRPWRQRP